MPTHQAGRLTVTELQALPGYCRNAALACQAEDGVPAVGQGIGGGGDALFTGFRLRRIQRLVGYLGGGHLVQRRQRCGLVVQRALATVNAALMGCQLHRAVRACRFAKRLRQHLGLFE